MKRSAAAAGFALVVLIAACDKSPAPAKAPDAAPAAPAPVAAATPAEAPEAVPSPPTAAILHPDAAKVEAAGPDSFSVHVVTSRGKFDAIVRRDWAPKGSDRFYYLVSNYYFDGIRFFRVLPGFMAQFGMSGDTAVNRVWKDKSFADDPVKRSNTRGMLTFANRGSPGTRANQLFINFGNNAQLDAMFFAPIGEVTKGMDVVESLFNGYGEGAPGGAGPDQTRINNEGNSYLTKDFPKLDYIVTARVSQEWKKAK
jgi:peptidyl-prolyl cis-trans isomerase A (cyclophilin A)